MVVDEKGLIRAMNEAYKGGGYKVAVEDQADIENVIIAARLWTVVIQKSELPRKVLGLIAEPGVHPVLHAEGRKGTGTASVPVPIPMVRTKKRGAPADQAKAPHNLNTATWDCMDSITYGPIFGK